MPRPHSSAREQATAPKAKFNLDILSLLVPAARRWPWLIVGTVVAFSLGLFGAMSLWRTGVTVTAQLVRTNPPVTSDAYQPQALTVPTLIYMVQSPDFLLRVGRQLNPPLSGDAVAARLRTNPERNTEILSVIAAGSDLRETVQLANLYTEEVIKFTKDAQRQDAVAAAGYVVQHLKETTAGLDAARKALPAVTPPLVNTDVSRTGAVTPPVDRYATRIETAKDELAQLLVQYTDIHPKVRAKRGEIAALQAQSDLSRKAAEQAAAPATATTPVTREASGGVSREEWELAFLKLRELQNLERLLVNRQQAIEVFRTNPPGNFRVYLPASADNARVQRPWIKIGLFATLCGLLGLTAAAGEMLFREFLDRRLKTLDDVARVTRLPIIATLGDLRQMSLSARNDWAFRTWIALQDRLAFSPHHGLICGITSSHSRDGRSTWISLLAGAARQCGFRVLTIATKPTEVQTPVDNEDHPAPESSSPQTAMHPDALLTNPPGDPSDPEFTSESEFNAITASALFTPAQITERLTGPEADPLVNIPLPGWTWNLERRKQWQGALNVWRKIDNVVILVELPPASVHESVLLASNLPNVVWLVETGKSEAAETRQQLDTLRHARCNLVGTVVNRAPASAAQGRLSRWVGCIGFVAALGLAGNSMMAADTSRSAVSSPAYAPPPSTATFSIVNPTQRAPWQQRFTLGPGDLLNLSIYGDAELTREEVPIGPDGRISFQEAHNVLAAGLTVDELREKLSAELGRFRRDPQAYVVPVAYKSKKYYVLGKVAQRGAFPLDRPITLIEAVARARGVETGLAADRSLVELADLSRAFIARRGQHLRVDFQKLFSEGDLTQNVALEPDDYIYFPAADLKEVYVVGSVRSPGAHAFTTQIGALGAIAARGGFTERAWKNRFLVVRGSLGQPETFIVDATDVLSGQKADIKLQPRDIVFVSDRPWARAEELIDAAASAFVTSAVFSWTDRKIVPIPQEAR
jgi:protein involved in polysaccharide export with SLBB domain/capsular polysaccharide biosynthesis protein